MTTKAQGYSIIEKLPEAFVLRTKLLLGEKWEAFEQALNTESPTSIRLNPKKMSFEHYCEQSEVVAEKVSWASDAYYLSSRPSFTLDPLFHAGCYYVQEASSMFLEQIIKKHITGKVKVLDLCAAPGGKSTQLSSVLPEESLLVANEVIHSRSYILAENLIKWGNANTIITNNDPATIGKLTSFFDIIVADVPCSGEGMFRKDPASIGEWSLQNVQLCSERQRRIIADIWSALAPGGLLVYSTCTYNREENEENIEWMCRELGAEIIEEPHRFMPHQTKGEGFFIAAVRKAGEKKEKQNKRGATKQSDTMANWLTNPYDFTFLSENTISIAIPSVHLEDYKQLKSQLKIVSAGIALGETKGRDFIPAHALAVSNSLSLSAFPTLELDKETALKYLKKEALQTLPPDLPRGHILVTYLHHPLGFVKNIGNRANNLYPQEWRIRMNIPA